MLLMQKATRTEMKKRNVLLLLLGSRDNSLSSYQGKKEKVKQQL